MRRLILVILMCLPGWVAAQEAAWTALTGGEIRAALTDRVVSYGEIWQDFRASGKTLYVSRREEWGNWRVEGNQYCSQWPPSSHWACYDIERNGDLMRFVGAGGDITTFTYRDE